MKLLPQFFFCHYCHACIVVIYQIQSFSLRKYGLRDVALAKTEFKAVVSFHFSLIFHPLIWLQNDMLAASGRSHPPPDCQRCCTAKFWKEPVR